MIVRVISILIVFGFTSACWAADAVEKVSRLPGIVELRIIDLQNVYLRAPENTMLNRKPYGNFQEDRHYIDGGTGAIKVFPDARSSNELSIKVGEEASNVTRFGGDTFKLIRIDKDSVTFHHSSVLRNGNSLEHDIIVSPYQK